METDLLPNVRGNFQTVRSMWTERVQEEQKSLRQKVMSYRSCSQKQETQPIKEDNRTVQIVDEIIIDNEPKLTDDIEERPFLFEPTEQCSSSSSDTNDSLDFTFPPPPLTPPSVTFQDHAQSIITLKESVAKLFDTTDKMKTNFPSMKKNGIRHWHLARHVFRSGLVFAPSRRASDSIIPVLMRTRMAHYRPRTESLDSTYNQTSFQNLIDYLSYKDEENVRLTTKKNFVKRTVSDIVACTQRNELNDTIAQYETVMRHLKNYDKFTASYPMPSSLNPSQKPRDVKEILKQAEENLQQNLTSKASIRTVQTQSLTRNAGRTFTEFIMSDLLCSLTPKPLPRLAPNQSTVHRASQTEFTEISQQTDFTPTEETDTAINELDNVLAENDDQQAPLTPNTEINVIIINSPIANETKLTHLEEKPLMESLFGGKKTAFTSADLQMESIRLPEDMLSTYETAKKKCFLPSEQLLYATNMIKIDRRGYKQHTRLLCLTTERIYIITKKNPYPKEVIPFENILSINCTPCKDGFICIHTKETQEDRGDWLFLVDHPCELITQLFVAMDRNHNNDDFLKLETKFSHIRRAAGSTNDEGQIIVRPCSMFRLEFEHYEALVIYTP